MKRQPRAHADRQEVRGKKGWEKRGKRQRKYKREKKRRKKGAGGETERNIKIG